MAKKPKPSRLATLKRVFWPGAFYRLVQRPRRKKSRRRFSEAGQATAATDPSNILGRVLKAGNFDAIKKAVAGIQKELGEKGAKPKHLGKFTNVRNLVTIFNEMKPAAQKRLSFLWFNGYDLMAPARLDIARLINVRKVLKSVEVRGKKLDLLVSIPIGMSGRVNRKDLQVHAKSYTPPGVRSIFTVELELNAKEKKKIMKTILRGQSPVELDWLKKRAHSKIFL